MRQSMRVTFAIRDFDRLKCIQAVIDGEFKPIRAAERLGLTTRHVRRLACRYAAAGPVGLISKRFSRPSNNRLHDAMADQVIKLLRSTYADFGPTLAAEKLRTKHGIDLAKETVRQLQIGVGLWIPRKLRPPKIQQPRMRRACIGELIQIDGCEHHWFEDRGPACTALVFIESPISWPIRQPIESTPANISM
jgi:Helix-turn-helix domain